MLNDQTIDTQTAESQTSISTILQLTFEKWYNDDIPRHAAVLAFYALFAIAPILLLCVEVLGLVYGRATAEKQVLTQITSFLNSTETAAWVNTFLQNILPSAATWWVTASFIVALLYGASSFFGELKIVLNRIWGVPLPEDPNLSRFLLRRLQAVLMVLISSLLIFFGLILTNWLSTATDWATLHLRMGSGYATWSYLILIFLLLTITFALIYKLVPDAHVAWKDVWIGAAATALLISITRLLISWYFNYSYTTTMFGAASALVVVLLSVYYSAQIFFLGAEFTYIYSQAYPNPADVQAEDGAEQHKKLQLRSTTPVQLDVVNIKSENPAPTPIPEPDPIAEPDPTRKSRFTQLTDRFRPRLLSRNRDTKPTTDHSANQLTDQSTNRPTDQSTNQPLWLRPLHSLRSSKLSRRSPNQPIDHSTTQPIDQSTTQPIDQSTIQPPDHLTTQPPDQSTLKQFILFPIRVLRPLHQIVVAVGVIFALSLAALAGIPFWKKRKNRGIADPIPDDPIAEDE